MSNWNPRAFIDMSGGYQSHREGDQKKAHDSWVRTTTWNLTRDDFIRLSYFHGNMEDGSNGLGPVNGSEDRPYDVVYSRDPEFHSSLTRSMVSEWLEDCSSYMHGYINALKEMRNEL